MASRSSVEAGLLVGGAAGAELGDGAVNCTGTGADYAYSPVTGLWYDMTCADPSADGSVACYGGNNAYVVLGAS
jgi:hypothetical protein